MVTKTTKKEPVKKQFVKYVKTVNMEIFFLIIGFSLLFLGMITGLFALGVYFAESMLGLSFMIGGAGFIVLWLVFLKSFLEDLTYNAETYYTEDDFDRVETIGVY